MQLTGKLIKRFDAVQVSDKFTKRDFVVQVHDNPQYPQEIIFQLVNNNVDQLKGLKENQEITVDFDIRGRMWTSPAGEDKWFNTLQAWRVEPMAENAQPVAVAVPTVPKAETLEDDDDMPF